MRLVITILWSLAALMWLPWLTIFLALLVDALMSGDFSGSKYFVPALVPIFPQFHWLGPWEIRSMWALSALLACGIVGLGWRIYWYDGDGILTRPARIIVASILLPPLAPVIMYRDARQRHAAKEQVLEAEVVDARQRITDKNPAG